MMRIDVISAVPDLLFSPINTSIIKRACERNKVEIFVHNLRDYAFDKHKQIDDKPFSGGAGMLLKPEPFFDCIELLLGERKYDYIIFPTPGGKLYEQKTANRYSLANNIMILAGHYKGVDDRVRAKFATDEISIGNYILTGGEIASIVIIDSIVRLIPGVLNDSESALDDSLMDGDIIEPPYYTRPAIFRDMRVPDVLLSGNKKKVKEWKEQQSIILTEKWKKLNSME
jgi:tRNA (guanine37-N1)-methyltransferase